jgi:crotonobetainyl-CoA:carnitine CoA-transferase CaiB-like acyl-CoA transferase
VVDISGYGQGGPLDHRRAYDLLIQSEAGSCAITGWPGQPAKPGIPIAVPALLPPALAVGWAAPRGRVPALGADTEAIRAEVAGTERKTSPSC